MEGVCFIDVNEEAMAFAVLTLKGNLQLYRVKNLGDQGVSFLDSCSLDWQASMADILRQRATGLSQSANQLSSDKAAQVSVRYIKILPESS